MRPPRFVVLLAVVGLASLAAAQTGVPSCYYNCLSTAFASSKCATTDTVCACADLDANRIVYECLVAVCSKDDVQIILNYSVELCKNAGYTYSPQAAAYITGGISSTSATPTATGKSAASTNTIGSASTTVSSPKSSGLSTGAIIGIAVAAGAVIIFVGLGAFLCIRRGNKKPLPAPLPADYPPKMQKADGMGVYYAPVPPVSPPPHQMPGYPPPHPPQGGFPSFPPHQQPVAHEVPAASAAPSGFYEMPGSGR
ncbi:hypothetical protein FN846DRAFT_343249 [Sphaerosporella brunnea]|uniref:CFEM domain-containing protein n=1 Tax=Sphaerosporella brunnea TaxID=1250544 RepID=A0A5J5EIX0_9PEZI|nr:hypothetical protein FN846DRAFT_343249 [Sphaerosporella brunnea]